MKEKDPQLAEALEKGNVNAIEKIVGERLQKQMDERKAEQMRRARLMNADPNDLEAQKEIEEILKKEMVDSNYSLAQEQYPEFFGHIAMLYVDVKVNGTPIQAFVDSGA